MYKVEVFEDKFQMFRLSEVSTNSSVEICTERGGIITSYKVNGEEIFYLDKETFYDEKSNIRGGNPILFPICGQLEQGKYELHGKEYKMKNHGVARTNAWKVIDTNINGEASIKLSLKSTEITKEEFPFDFELIFTYTLKNGKLIIDQEYINNSEETMPIYAGFHPYFKALEKNVSYDTDAENYLDYNDMKIKNYTGSIDLSNMVESAAFIDSKRNNISFKLNDLKRNITLNYGEEFKYIVLWSVKDKEFICVEPWMARNGALNSKEGLQYINPGEKLKTFLSFEVQTNI
ncbi:aldose 1-epimerase [Clostridiales bacterium oral taxon 876 str. F0540]|nr:aldose 1-epimerase [Clostridiales bacterium oral taxon 876 str. F0540]